MALTTTTLSSALAASATSMTVTSATGFVAGYKCIVDGEELAVAASYSSGTTIPILRGQGGTAVVAHVSGANVSVGLPSDYANSGNPATSAIVNYPTAGRSRTVTSYGASGAIALPAPGSDAVAVLNGTSTLTMTLADPSKDLDGCILHIVGNGKSSSTISNAAGSGFGAGGASYDVLTLQNAGRVWVSLLAINGTWQIQTAAGMTGTVTALTAGIA